MSDDDFVSRPKLRTYKRRKRSAPLTPSPLPHPPLLTAKRGSEEESADKPDKILSLSSAEADSDKHVLSTDTNTSKKPTHTSPNIESDLEAFLESIPNCAKLNTTSSPVLADLEIETVRRDEEDEAVVQSEQAPAKPSLAGIKLAIQTLVSKSENKSLRQQSLFSKVTYQAPPTESGGYPSRVTPHALPSDHSQAPPTESGGSENVSDTVSSHRDLGHVTHKPVCERRLVKQPGTNQLDLGAMFGMKPKTPPTPAVKTLPTKSPAKGKSGWKPRKVVPPYKWITGTDFTVDAFNFGEIAGCRAYFLSHYHADHYVGLGKAFTGKLYCSKVTSNYVINYLKVPEDRVTALSFGDPVTIEGVEVTLVEANHCPGSAMFLFRSQKIGCVLHTGDFRYEETMLLNPVLAGIRFSSVYLDTTYFDASYSFPPQAEVVGWMEDQVESFTKDTLVVVGAYTIGKERIAQAIAERLNSTICVNQTKMNLIKLQDNLLLTKRLCKNINSRVHIVPMKEIREECLAKLLARTRFTSVVGVRPTGWTHTQGVALQDIKPSGRGVVRVYAVPYSEHSSYRELEEFVKAIRVTKVIPTVFPRSEPKKQLMFEKLREWTTSIKVVDYGE